MKTTKKITDDDIMSRVLHRDGMILVVDKPAGLAVHKSAASDHSLEQYFHLLTYGLRTMPVLAHRLDRATSGCLVLARHPKAARAMHNLFVDGKIKKTYFAWVHGIVSADHGRIDVPLARQSAGKNDWRMKTDDAGQEAITDFVVEKRLADRSLLKLTPLTGRTHQLRVHCASLGHPIMGDTIYGHHDNMALQLLAHSIEIPRKNKDALVVTAPWPAHMLS